MGELGLIKVSLIGTKTPQFKGIIVRTGEGKKRKTMKNKSEEWGILSISGGNSERRGDEEERRVWGMG